MSHQSKSSPVLAYLRELDIAARDLPQSVRVDLRARIVRELVAKSGDSPSEALVADAIAALGDPAELVAVQRASYGIEPDHLLPRDVAAVYLVGSGPFLLGLGVVLGLILLWSSRRWPLRQRKIATGLFVAGAGATFVLPVALPVITPLLALVLGTCAIGPWSAAAYLGSVRVARRLRAANHVQRQDLS